MTTIYALYFNTLWYSQADLFGIGSIVDMTIKDMDPIKSLQLSDICWDAKHDYMVDAVNYNVHNDMDTEPYHSINNIMATNNLHGTANNIIQFTDKDDYLKSNKKYNLFGILPWDADVLATNDGKYVCKITDGTNIRQQFNPLRREVLMRKSISVLVIGVSIVVTYKMSKYGYHKLKNIV